MNYKLVVLDMDGTLLNSRKEVSKENQNALKMVQEKGILVAIATGRIFTSARFYAKILGIKAPIIACNGALVRDDSTNEVLDINPINKEAVLKVIHSFRKHNVYFHIYDEEKIYVEKLGFSSAIYDAWNEDQSEENKIHIEKLEDAYDYFKNKDINILKMMAVDDDNSKIESIRKDLEGIADISLDKSWHNNLEVMSKGVSKGKGIDMLRKIYKVRPDEIIAFGDNFNDLSMKDYVGTFVAMGNAEEYVKNKADYVTTSNDDSGVAKGIEELVINSKSK